MAPTLNQEDIKLLKGIFATKEDLVSMEGRFDKKFATKEDLKAFATKEDLKRVVVASEKKIIKKVDFMINVLDKDLMKFAREVDRVKIHVGLPILN